MYDNQLYADGTRAVLKVCWRMLCETPLVIRNGPSVHYTEDTRQPKTRGRDMKFVWAPKKEEGGIPGKKAKSANQASELAALTYGYRVVGGNRVEAYHSVPPSSVRGALRSWTINHLVDAAYRDRFVAPSAKDASDETAYREQSEAYVGKVVEALGVQSRGYQLIASLFGLALETRSEDLDLSNAGRLSLETTPFAHDDQPQPIDANGTVVQPFAGPGNARRQMTVRNPLDRVTHASKDGGLHHFLEFRRGESFDVNFSVRNPQPADLGLFYLWQRELTDGLLRIGALSNIGRGRVSIQNPSYELWQLAGQPPRAHFVKQTDVGDDVLAGLWEKYTLDPADLHHFESGLINHVQ